MVDEAWELGIRHNAEIGWAIGRGETYSDLSRQDDVEADALYDLLEGEIVPAFYARRADGLPMKWISRMKASIAILCPEFNMHRMVKQYTNEYYMVAHNRYLDLGRKMGPRRRLSQHGLAGSKRPGLVCGWSRLRTAFTRLT